MTLGEELLIVAGQCTIDPKNPNYFLETAAAVKEAGAHVIRGGVWKPRTNPYTFQGDNKSMEILMEASRQTGLPVDTEVMDEDQLTMALEAGVQMLQVGEALQRAQLLAPALHRAGCGEAEHRGAPKAQPAHGLAQRIHFGCGIHRGFWEPKCDSLPARHLARARRIPQPSR